MVVQAQVVVYRVVAAAVAMQGWWYQWCGILQDDVCVVHIPDAYATLCEYCSTVALLCSSCRIALHCNTAAQHDRMHQALTQQQPPASCICNITIMQLHPTWHPRRHTT